MSDNDLESRKLSGSLKRLLFELKKDPVDTPSLEAARAFCIGQFPRNYLCLLLAQLAKPISQLPHSARHQFFEFLLTRLLPDVSTVELMIEIEAFAKSLGASSVNNSSTLSEYVPNSNIVLPLAVCSQRVAVGVPANKEHVQPSKAIAKTPASLAPVNQGPSEGLPSAKLSVVVPTSSEAILASGALVLSDLRDYPPFDSASHLSISDSKAPASGESARQVCHTRHPSSKPQAIGQSHTEGQSPINSVSTLQSSLVIPASIITPESSPAPEEVKRTQSKSATAYDPPLFYRESVPKRSRKGSLLSEDSANGLNQDRKTRQSEAQEVADGGISKENYTENSVPGHDDEDEVVDLDATVTDTDISVQVPRRAAAKRAAGSSRKRVKSKSVTSGPIKYPEVGINKRLSNQSINRHMVLLHRYGADKVLGFPLAPFTNTKQFGPLLIELARTRCRPVCLFQLILLPVKCQGAFGLAVIRPAEGTIKYYYETSELIPKDLEQNLKKWLEYEWYSSRRYLTHKLSEEVAQYLENIHSWSYEALIDEEWNLHFGELGRKPVGAVTCLLATELMQAIVQPHGISMKAVREMTSREFRSDFEFSIQYDGLGWFRED